jgi:LCP family protein required for cell wall assembly
VLIVSLLVLANLAVLGLLWGVSTGQDFLAGANTNQEVVEVLTEPTGDSLTFLIVGSDTREGLDDLTNFGNFSGERGDVVMLVRMDPGGEAKILSIPRDLFVDIPGYGENRINAAYAFGGASLMVDTIQSSLGIPVNHYVEVDFVGFIALVDELGGIELTFDYQARDRSSGLDVDAGTQTVDGAQALAYARSRKYQEYQKGSWVSVDANDIGRTGRQQEVLKAIMSELKSPSTVAEAGSIAAAVSKHMTVDASLASASVAGLAWNFRGILTAGISGVTLPVRGAVINGASVVVADEPDARTAIDEFLAGIEATSRPLRLLVLNGNGVGGSAAALSETLVDAGFTVPDIGDADNKAYQTTTVVVPQGSADGSRIVEALGFGVVEFGNVDNDFDAVVIVGSDAS